MNDLVDFLPIVTTLVALAFTAALVGRYRKRGGAHLAWWTAGVVAYGSGTAIESWITLSGNTVPLNKAWYVAGAVLGAYPLAQGTVYLLLSTKRAHLLTAITLPLVVFLSVSVALSPIDADALDAERPGGGILGWTWIRALTPIINGYAAAFLIGGAIASAVHYHSTREAGGRTLGNALIAAGAILPAIGGGMAKAGHVQALYVAELSGLILIFAGYVACVRTPLETENVT